MGNATCLPWPDKHFDLVISITTLHNLYVYDLFDALSEMERVGKNNKYLCVESYRNEQEKANLLYWQVTCEAFNTPEEWNGGSKRQTILEIIHSFFSNEIEFSIIAYPPEKYYKNAQPTYTMGFQGKQRALYE